MCLNLSWNTWLYASWCILHEAYWEFAKDINVALDRIIWNFSTVKANSRNTPEDRTIPQRQGRRVEALPLKWYGAAGLFPKRAQTGRLQSTPFKPGRDWHLFVDFILYSKYMKKRFKLFYFVSNIDLIILIQSHWICWWKWGNYW